MWGTWMSRSPCVETDRHVNNNNTTTALLVGRIAEPFRGRGSLGHCLQAWSLFRMHLRLAVLHLA